MAAPVTNFFAQMQRFPDAPQPAGDVNFGAPRYF